MPFPPEFVDDTNPPGPGREHETIQEALKASDADRTRSILDIDRVGTKADFGVARRLTEEELQEHFGTTTPTREQILAFMPTEDIERGETDCLTVYDEVGYPVGISSLGIPSIEARWKWLHEDAPSASNAIETLRQ